MSIAYLPATNRESEHIILRGATLIDGNGGDPITDSEIEVRDGRIVYVGSRRDEGTTSAREGNDAGDTSPRVIQLQGKTIMPGFIDSHVHFGLTVENPAANLARFASERIVRSVVNARNTLMAGVTTARDLGGTDRGIRDSIEQGLILGPRIHLAISPLSPTGGHTVGEQKSPVLIGLFLRFLVYYRGAGGAGLPWTWPSGDARLVVILPVEGGRTLWRYRSPKTNYWMPSRTATSNSSAI